MSLNRNRRWGVKGAEAPLGPPGPLGSRGYPWAPFLSLGRHPAGPYVFHFSSFAKGYQHSSKWKLLQLVVANANFRLASFSKYLPIHNNLPREIAFHSKWLQNNPKWPWAQSLPRAPKAPLAPPGSPWLPLAPVGTVGSPPVGCPWVPLGPLSLPLASLGSPWVPSQGIGTLLKRRKGVSRVWWRSGFTGERILGRRHARKRIWIVF